MRILVTGAAGFIGYHLCDRLSTRHSVLGLDDLNSYYDVSLKIARVARLRNCPVVPCDVANRDVLLAELEDFKPDVVVHLAAQAGVRHSLDKPFAYTRANVDGFLSVLEACRAHPVKHLVYASSSSVYGSNTKVPFSETDAVLSPCSLYAATKRANELMATAYAHLFGIPCTGLRFFTVYGPWGRPDMAYWKFTEAVLNGRPIDVYGHGRMLRDFTYIDDVVDAIERLIHQEPSGHTIYNVGNNQPVELGRFIAAIETATGCAAMRNLMPMQPGDVPATWADIDRIKAATGWEPKTRIEDGIGRFVSWYRDYHRIAIAA